MKEGKTVVPGPALSGETPFDDKDKTTINLAPSQTSLSQFIAPVEAAPVKIKSNLDSSQSSNHSQGLLYDPLVLEQAQKYSRYAISALQYEDLKTAVENLEKALNLIKPLKKD